MNPKLLFLLIFCSCLPKPNPTTIERNWSVHFSPNGGCTETVVDLIRSAKSTINMQAYSFTSSEIAEALITQGRSGVQVTVIADKSDVNGKGSKIEYLQSSNIIKVLIDSKHAIAHNKVVVVDGEIVETGSFNYTEAAERHNAENCLVIRDHDLAQEYLKNWNEHAQHSHQ
jgi:phosphatidylserine/phosphatidylglycerophosphate/cardiolipin synthase-like enzyme